MIKVRLTENEMRMAASTGVERQLSSLSKGLKDKHGFDGSTPWEIHINGSLAEAAAAKGLDIFYRGDVDTFKNADLGGNIQVRHTKMEPPQLIVRPTDSDNDIFVLVTGAAPEYTLHGWMMGKDAKQNKWSRGYAGRPPAFFVPLEELNDIHQLKEHCQ